MSNLRKNNARKVMTTSAAAALAATAVAPVAVSADDHTFSDVPTDHHYYDQIEALVDAGVIQGNEEGMFMPDDSMTRASAAEMLAKALDLQPEGENTFSDVPDDHWAVDSITALYEAGVVQGDEDGDFNPSDKLSRAAIAEMVVKAYDLELNESNETTFDDVPEGEWYAEEVNILASHGLVEGNGEGQYSPENDMQRQHFAKLVYDAEVAYGDMGDGSGEDIDVQSVTTVNATTLEVKFSSPVESFDVEFANSDLEVTGQSISEDGLTATVNFSGASFDNHYEVTIANATNSDEVVAEDYTEWVEVAPVDEYYDIKFDYDAEDNNGNGVADITADGASRTMVTAKIIDDNGETVDDMNGVIRFDSTRGGLAQSEVTIKDGEASVQLTSEASSNSVFSDITATIVNSPENTAFEGLKDTSKVEFLPEGEDQEVSQVVPMSAESNQADRLFVSFGSDVDLSDEDFKDSLQSAITVNGGDNAVKDIKQESSRVVEVILNTDPGDDENESNALADNARHTVEFDPVTDVVTEAELAFNLTDTTKQYVYDVSAENQITIDVEYAESVAFGTNKAEEVYDANKLDNYLLDGEPLPEGTHATLSNDRKTVTLTLPASEPLSEGATALQVKNVGDWAGATDENNRISTQTIDFNVPFFDEKPTASVEKQSPEQYFIEFSTPVSKFDTDSLTVEYQDPENEDSQLELTEGTDSDYTVYDYPTDSDDIVTGVLVEFTQDWTEILDTEKTNNAYHSGSVNPLTFTIAEGKLEDFLGNKNDEITQDFNLSIDAESPTIDQAVDLSTIDNTYDAGLGVDVEMSEPIQMNVNNDDGTNEITPSQNQDSNNGVPTPTFEFVKGDQSISGQVVQTDEGDQSFVIEPSEQLGDGDWTLYIRSISDDIGNTSSTEEYTFTVESEETEVVEADPEILYANYENGEDGSYDKIEVKFSTVMNNLGANAVGRTTNYVMNGTTLADLGSSVRKGIDGVTDEWDGATILLPEGTLGDNEDFILNVADNMASTNGDSLTGQTELDLQDEDTEDASTSAYNTNNLALNGYTITSSEYKTSDLDSDDNQEVDSVTVTFENEPSVSGEQFAVNGTIIDVSEEDVSGNEVTITLDEDDDVEAQDGVIVTANGQVIGAVQPEQE